MKKLLTVLSYVLVFVLAVCATTVVITANFMIPGGVQQSQVGLEKLGQLQALIGERFIGEVDETALADSAAAGMVAALGDEWSYYISAVDYASYMEQMNNAYVGIGITITVREDGYLDIMKVEKGGPAEAAGILAGDVLIKVDGQDCAGLGIDAIGSAVKGEEGTAVDLTLKRGEEAYTVTVERKLFEVVVAEYEMLEDGVGLVTIYNFDERCADETLTAVEELLEQGAQALIFDVRNNPGGYKEELVEVLDYLLPEGDLFTSEFYDGKVEVDKSDAAFLDIPMAVLVNSESYSAAEFFAAALSEYDAAVTVGEQTYGKGYFQQTFQLMDGSAVGLSVGKYYTPEGRNLAGEGITPDVVVEVDTQTFLDIYYGNIESSEDPQILAAVEAIKTGN